MNKIVLLLLIVMMSSRLAAQVISVDAKYAFPEQGISIDEKYVFAVNRTSEGTGNLVVKAVSGAWRKEIHGTSMTNFIPDGKGILFLSSDTLYNLTLGSEEKYFIPHVASYSVTKNDSGVWLVYALNNAKQVLVRNLSTLSEHKFDNITHYTFNKAGSALLLETVSPDKEDNVVAMDWFDLQQEKILRVWSSVSGSILTDMQFDTTSQQLAMMVRSDTGSLAANAIWYYKAGMDKAVKLVDNTTAGTGTPLEISKRRGLYDDNQDPCSFRFTEGGKHLLFYFQEPPRPAPDKDADDVWSYTDAKVYSLQLMHASIPRTFAAVINLQDHHVVRLEQENEKVIDLGDHLHQVDDQHALVCHFDDDIFAYDVQPMYEYRIVQGYSSMEYQWNKATRYTVYLISLVDGSRTALKEKVRPYSSMWPYYTLSPAGKYVVYYDPEKKNYFSYEISTRTTRNITGKLLVSWNKGDDQEGKGSLVPIGVMAWQQADAAVFIQDHYFDVWKVDMALKRPSVNITKGMCRRNEWFQYVTGKPLGVFGDHQYISVVATPNINSLKRYGSPGYYLIPVNTGDSVVELLKPGGNYRYDIAWSNTHAWIVSRQNANVPADYFYTRDFKSFLPIESSEPEQRAGVKKELLTWKTLDGRMSVGVLYKPKKFDPNKKYPLIITYYEKRRAAYDYFENYDADGGVGGFGPDYLFCIADINYTYGETGQCAYNAIVSVAQYLARRPYVNAAKMGITGQSFGGYETNYIAIHSHIFAAAITYCGASDFISLFGSENKDVQGIPRNDIEQYRIGKTIWERPDLVIKNSPVFYADKATTPLLLIHGKNDERVPYSQSVELFKAMRFNGKKAWLISRTDGHGVLGSPYAKQFFDHYLNDKPAAMWMLQGIPARSKAPGKELEMDSAGRTPGPGLTYDK
jgi:dienelactone hydrolase